MNDLFLAAWAVFAKDVRSELRTRYALNALVLFAASVAVAVSFAVPQLGLQRDPQSLVIQSALLWIALLFAALSGLSRSFVQEEERRTTLALRLAAPPLAVYLGKFLFNLVLLVLLDTITTLLFLAFLRVEIGNTALFLASLAMGALCLTTATTLLAAIIAQANFKGGLFAVLAFPLIVPLLVVAIQSTTVAIGGGAWSQGEPLLRFLLAYAVATFVASLLLFRFVWEA
jgi:heme exporter protein B